ncbi:hypothetical protein N1851_028528 [Merluccius polli]|uniref:Uncharacterized protein n=1 Tax=Merluccius polli TaxID=89951 RepID=A0AA47NTF7_MERPO|nr:hypothetical protein N1851_028528 [Merluccius polli]
MNETGGNFFGGQRFSADAEDAAVPQRSRSAELTFLGGNPQFSYVVNASSNTVNEVTNNLDDIGTQLGSHIQQRFRGPLQPAMDSVVLLEQDAGKINNLLKELHRTTDQLQLSVNGVQDNLSAVRDKVNQTFLKPACINCIGLQPELQKLTVDTTFVVSSIEV